MRVSAPFAAKGGRFCFVRIEAGTRAGGKRSRTKSHIGPQWSNRRKVASSDVDGRRPAMPKRMPKQMREAITASSPRAHAAPRFRGNPKTVRKMAESPVPNEPPASPATRVKDGTLRPPRLLVSSHFRAACIGSVANPITAAAAIPTPPVSPRPASPLASNRREGQGTIPGAEKGVGPCCCSFTVPWSRAALRPLRHLRLSGWLALARTASSRPGTRRKRRRNRPKSLPIFLPESPNVFRQLRRPCPPSRFELFRLPPSLSLPPTRSLSYTNPSHRSRTLTGGRGHGDGDGEWSGLERELGLGFSE